MNYPSLTQFKNVLKQEKLRFTPQRFEVFKEVCTSRKHREAEEIYLTLKRRNVRISRATVYRTMDILFTYDLVRRMDIGDKRWRYEQWLDSAHHDHIICVRCGKIVEFVSEEIEHHQKEICNRFEYTLLRHMHQLFGLCKNCQAS